MSKDKNKVIKCPECGRIACETELRPEEIDGEFGWGKEGKQ